MRHHPTIVFASLLFYFSGLVCSAENTAERLVAEEQRILQNTKTSEYAHKTEVDEQAGSYKLDCSGLVCFALKKVSPEALKDVPKSGTEKRQLAHDFYEFFKNAPTPDKVAPETKWVKIEKFADTKPGDVIAWKNEDYKPGENTGHVMLIVEAPVADGENIYKVVVIDSSAHGHGSDTRKKGESGVGRGTLWFTVNKDGEAIGVRFTSKTGTLNTKSISIGRLQ